MILPPIPFVHPLYTNMITIDINVIRNSSHIFPRNLNIPRSTIPPILRYCAVASQTITPIAAITRIIPSLDQMLLPVKKIIPTIIISEAAMNISVLYIL